MSKKTAQPALYEKMRTRPSAAASVPLTQDLANGDVFDGPGLTEMLSPGRTIRLPVGYMFLAAGIAIILIWFAYMVGHSRGKTLASNEAQDRYASEVTGAQGGAINDPLKTLEPVGAATSTNGKGVLGNAAPKKPESSKPETVKSAPPGTWGPVVPKEDPRKKGLSYFVLAETSLDGAQKLAEFCRTNGLETYVVSGKDSRFRQVVAFPGFEPAARTGAQAKALESLIHSIGEKWKSTRKGATDLSDAYPKQFNG